MEEEVALLVQPPRKLAQVASGKLGRLHPYEGSGEREVLALEEQKAAEARSRERSDSQGGHHHRELEMKVASSDQSELHQLYAR